MRLLLLLALMVPTPEGFRESVRLEPISSAVSGKPTFVLCARTDSAWQAKLSPWPYLRAADAITFHDEDGSYFARLTCQRLEGWLRGKNAPTPAELGRAVLSLVHEANHVRGVIDESDADCAALRQMPAVLKRWFGIKRAKTLRAVMNAAWADHRAAPAVYRTSC